MGDLSIGAFHKAVASGGHVEIQNYQQDNPKEMVLVSAKRSLKGKFLDWVAGGVIGKRTAAGKQRLSENRDARRRAFILFAEALKTEYGVGKNELASATLKSNIGKALREAFRGKVPKLNARNLAKMEEIAKNFKGMGEAKKLERNFVVRWWRTEGVVRTGHAAAGIRNRITNPNEKEKYVSFWPGGNAGGLGEIGRAVLRTAQEGTLMDDSRSDSAAEISTDTNTALNQGYMAREKLAFLSPKKEVFFSDLEKVPLAPRNELELAESLELLASAVMKLDQGYKQKMGTGDSLMDTLKSLVKSFEKEHKANSLYTLKSCINQMKNRCNNREAQLQELAQFQPRARQKRYERMGIDSETNKEAKLPYWGLKPEKFYLPLAGKNQVKDGEGKFMFFGLNEGNMVERHDELHEKNPMAQARSDVLYLSDKDIKKGWDRINTPKTLLGFANKLKEQFDPTSDQFKTIDTLISEAKMVDYKSGQAFVHSLQEVAKTVDHQTPYRMASRSENCSGMITDLMALGGAEAFASKPLVLVTGPNDTAKWAKAVLVTVERLNQQANEIMTHLDPNEKRQPGDVEMKCPPEVWKAYQSAEANVTLNQVEHKDFMADMKVLVEAISNAKNFDRSIGALLLKSLLPIYEKAGNPVQ